MKIFNTFIFVLFVTPAYAEIYKCIDNGKTSYQQIRCKQKGTEFIPEKDISIEQQQSAVKKLTADLKVISEKKKLLKEADDKERLLRSQEENARANRAQAEETARQTEAIEESNNRLINQPYIPYYPLRPIKKPLPIRPITKPLPNIPAAKSMTSED